VITDRTVVVDINSTSPMRGSDILYASTKNEATGDIKERIDS